MALSSEGGGGGSKRANFGGRQALKSLLPSPSLCQASEHVGARFATYGAL